MTFDAIANLILNAVVIAAGVSALLLAGLVLWIGVRAVDAVVRGDA